VPVWVRVYDVPWGKQDEVTGRKFGNGLGKALEVDVPKDEQDKKEFLRVRVALPYDRRLQTQVTTGVKGKPWAVKVYKLKYERVPYYCSHCGFMGHRKYECEKERQGAPSLDYDAHELRCSPYKKFEHRAYYVPPAAKRELSFASFGSAESRKSAHRPASVPPLNTAQRQSGFIPDQVGSRDGFDEEEMPGLEDIQATAVGQELPAQVEALHVASLEQGATSNPMQTVITNQPIVQLPEDECQDLVGQLEATYAGETKNDKINGEMLDRKAAQASSMPDMQRGHGDGNVGQQYRLHPNMLRHMSPWLHQGMDGAMSSPASSDMIPAMRNLSNTTVSLTSMTDVDMLIPDSVLGKRGADEPEVQGQKLELSLGLSYGTRDGGVQKKGKKEGHHQERRDTGKMKAGSNLVYERKKAATGHGASGQLARPNVWSRQQQ
jgi:hypothetical protein